MLAPGSEPKKRGPVEELRTATSDEVNGRRRIWSELIQKSRVPGCEYRWRVGEQFQQGELRVGGEAKVARGGGQVRFGGSRVEYVGKSEVYTGPTVVSVNSRPPVFAVTWGW